MKVILRQSIPTLGDMGAVVNVKDGYARNYLIPHSFAFIATPKAIKALDYEKKLFVKKQEREKIAAEELANQFADLQISIAMKVGEEGKLYGSVTNQMIAQELALRNFNIDKRNIIMEDAIRTCGIFSVKVKLHSEVIAPLKIWVISED